MPHLTVAGAPGALPYFLIFSALLTVESRQRATLQARARIGIYSDEEKGASEEEHPCPGATLTIHVQPSLLGPMTFECDMQSDPAILIFV